jgi:hypothetical protein
MMDEAQTAKAPWHLWAVGLLALVLNGFHCVDYTMTRMRNVEWLSMGGADPQAMLAWVDGFPIYAQFGWGLGAWAGLAGAILLFMRHRWAVPALGLSFLGALISLGYQNFVGPTAPPPMDDRSALAMMSAVIIVLTAAFYYYAHRQRKAGVLR